MSTKNHDTRKSNRETFRPLKSAHNVSRKSAARTFDAETSSASLRTLARELGATYNTLEV